MSQEFFNAITQGDVARVHEMLATSPQLATARDENGLSPVLKATYYGKRDIVDVLLNRNIELNAFEAAATGRTERLRNMIKGDVSLVHAFSSDGFTLLGLSVFFGHAEAVELLLAAGADVNIPSRESMKVTPLHSAAASKRVAIGRVLIAHGANVKAEGATGFTALHSAASNGDLEFAQLLVDHGAGVNAKTQDGKTPLSLAVEHKHQEMAGFLRSRGGQ